MIKDKLIPKRRFKEFKNDEAWEQRKLDKEVEFYSGLTYSPKDVSDEGTLVLRSSNVKNGEIVDADNVYVNPEVVNSCNVKEGDIIVVVRNGSRSLIGKHAQVKKTMDNTVIGAFMTGVRSNQSGFINALMDTQQFNKETEKNLGATINQITNRMFCEMTFMFPCYEEQEKIGTFFNNLDNLITLHQRKLKKLKELKLAYLSEMFPEEGKKYPKRRFAGFTDPWEQRKLSDFVYKAVDNRGKTPPLDSNGTHPLIEVASLGAGSPDYSKVEKYLNDYSFEHHLRGYVKKGDILFSTVGSIGQVSLMDSQENAAIAQNIVAFRAKEEYFPEYLYVLFSIKSSKAKAYRIAMGAVQPSIKVSQLIDVEYFVTKSEEEQKLIGKFFLQLDNLITLHQRKLEKLENIKKAYLNEMFV